MTSPTAGLQSNAFSTKTIVQTTLLTIQIGYDIQHVGSFDHQFDIVRIKNLKIKSFNADFRLLYDLGVHVRLRKST